MIRVYNLFSPKEYKRNGKIILKHFLWQRSIVTFAIDTERSKKTKISCIFKKSFDLFIVCSKCGHEYK